MEGLFKLGIDIPDLIAQVINFAILFGLLYLVAYRPVMRMLDERSRRIKESMEKAEEIDRQRARTEEESKKRIEQASQDGQKIIERAERAGDERRKQAQQEAQQQAETVVNRARQEIQHERDKAVGELREEFADLTIKAASKVIERSLDKKAHKELIDKVLEESAGKGKE